jgi:pimeloyl-ACP methyl ester carboxylesterase
MSQIKPSAQDENPKLNTKELLVKLFQAFAALEDQSNRTVAIPGVGNAMFKRVADELIQLIITKDSNFNYWHFSRDGELSPDSVVRSEGRYAPTDLDIQAMVNGLSIELQKQNENKPTIPTVPERRAQVEQVMESLKTPIISAEQSKLQVNDESLRRKMEAIMTPKNMRVFARRSAEGLHVIGVENIEKTEKPDVIALHEILHGNWAYIDFLQHFANHNQSIQAVSWPGSCESMPLSKPQDDLLVNDYIESFEKFLDKHGKPCYLMGHGVGGIFAQLLAVRRPHQVQGLILLASYPPSTLRYRAGSKKINRDREWLKNNIFNVYCDEEKEPPILKWVLNNLDQQGAPMSLVDDYSLMGRGSHIDPRDMRCPIIEVEGEDDQIDVAVFQDSGSRGVIEMSPRRYNDHPERRKSLAQFYCEAQVTPPSIIIMCPKTPHSMLFGGNSGEIADEIFNNWNILTDNPPKK